MGKEKRALTVIVFIILALAAAMILSLPSSAEQGENPKKRVFVPIVIKGSEPFIEALLPNPTATAGENWDKSSLTFEGSCMRCQETCCFFVTVCNTGE